jgi:hypothetical protein
VHRLNEIVAGKLEGQVGVEKPDIRMTYKISVLIRLFLDKFEHSLHILMRELKFSVLGESLF